MIGQTLSEVTKSLEIALFHLAPEAEPLTLWIDALCIDQNDEVEKTEQVQQMHHIYSQAASVITWLGPATENSDAAMLWIQCYGSLAHRFGIGTKPDLQLRPLLHTFESDPGRLPQQALVEFLRDIPTQLSSSTRGSDNVVVALYELFTRPYWSRVWIVQELAFAKHVQFVCGKMAVPEELLHHSLRLLRNFTRYERIKLGQTAQQIISNPASTQIDVRNPVNVLKIRRTAGPFPLMYLIRTLRFFQASDPRDRVFALLSFAIDAASLGIKADYQKSYQEVYLETTMALIKEGFLDILSLGQPHKNISGLPSWVPDFTNLSHRLPLQQRAMDRKAVPVTTTLQPGFGSSGGHKQTKDSYEFATTSPVSLLLSAKLVGRVARVGNSWEQDSFGRWFKQLKQLFGCDATPSSHESLKSVWRTAVADQECRKGDQKPRLSEPELEKIHRLLGELNLDGADEQTFVALGLGDYVYQLQDVANGRRPFCTVNGHVGIGPSEMLLGDLVYIIVGADVPYILRSNTNGKLQLVGECYVHGVMDGEAMDGGEPIDVIDLC